MTRYEGNKTQKLNFPPLVGGFYQEGKTLLNAKSKIDLLTTSNFIKMADFPYSTVAGKIPELLRKIKGIGVPSKVDQAWLKTIGYTSSNDPSLITVLKFIDFVDATSSVPTEKWKRHRSNDSALAEGIKLGYKELFDLYPDAPRRGKNDLVSFFKSKSTAGDQAIKKTIATFNNLCELADFSSVLESSVTHSHKHEDKPHSSPHKPKDTDVFTKSVDAGNNVTININIQLTIPETRDETIYEKFFAAMKKHLLSN